MLIDNLRINLGNPSTSEISDDALQQCVDSAILEFSKFQGEVKLNTSLKTVEDQQEYDLSSITDLISVVDVFWRENPFGSIEYSDSSLSLFDNPSLRKIYDYKKARYLEKYEGSWERQKDALFITPAPTENDEKIVIIYRSLYAEGDLSSEQENVVLIYAEFLARKILIGYDITAKVGSVSTDKKTMWQIARALRDDFYRRVKG